MMLSQVARSEGVLSRCLPNGYHRCDFRANARNLEKNPNSFSVRI
jgi:hypothetical protein